MPLAAPPGPLWSADAKEPHPLQLGNLLSNVGIHWQDAPEGHGHNLLNYLISPPLKKGDLCKTAERSSSLPDRKDGKRNTVNRFREAYSGLQILDATPRELLDLWLHLRKQVETCQEPAESSGDRKDNKSLRWLIKYASPVMEEQDFLTEEDQEILRFTFPTSDRDDLQLGTDRLRVIQKFSPWRRSPDDEKTIFVRGHLDWRLGILDSESQECECQGGRKEERYLPGKNALVHGHVGWKYCTCNCGSQRCKCQNRWDKKDLPPRQRAWLILLHDLAWSWRRNSVQENLVQRLLREIRDSSNQIESIKDLGTKHPGWAWYRGEKDGKSQDKEKQDKEKQGHWVHFPLPDADTFRQLDRFLAIWSKGPSSNDGEDVEPPVRFKDAVHKWAIAAWIAKEGSEDSYEKYLELLEGEDWDGYEKCALSLAENQDLDDSAEKDGFREFRKALFDRYPTLLECALGGRE